MIREIDLNGEWELFWGINRRGVRTAAELPRKGDFAKLRAAVPGEVHTDLLNAGLIEDFRVQANILKARWIEESQWFYRKNIFVEHAEANTFLEFKRLDCLAYIYVNRVLVGKHSNAFLPARFDVGKFLKNGENEIIVGIDAGFYESAMKSEEDCFFEKEERNFPLTKRNYLRKPAYQFGWDWSEQLVNVGISGEVKLRSGKLLVGDVSVVPHYAMDGNSTLTVFGCGFGSGIVSVKVNGADCGMFKIDGTTRFESLAFDVGSPEPWYPRGYGEQNMYDFDVRMYDGNGEQIFEKNFCIGFRNVEIDKGTQATGDFAVKVNGKRIFCKGMNWVSSDLICLEHDRKILHAFDCIADSGANMLRVWGGGCYESEDFYGFCDKEGILVWQDFPFSCCGYPWHDADFRENVEKEIEYNIVAHAHHASLVLWCGGNEILWHGYDITGTNELTDKNLYCETLKNAVERVETGWVYHESSPYSPLAGPHHNDGKDGDKHIWEISFYDTDYRKYKHYPCRFISEAGYLGIPNYATFIESVGSECFEPDSLPFILHDNSVAYPYYSETRLADDSTFAHIGSLDDHINAKKCVYLSGLVQGEALKALCEAAMSDEFRCSGVLIWMLNDCWPTVRSWSLLDWKFRKSLSYYKVRECFSDVVVLFGGDGKEYVYVVNNSQEAFWGEITLGFTEEDKLDFVSVCVPPHASRRFPMRNGKGIAYAVAKNTNGVTVAQNRRLKEKLRDLKLAPAHIRVLRKDSETVELVSDTLVIGVCIDIMGEAEDNMFDLYPSVPKTIKCKGQNIPEILFTANEFIADKKL